VHNYYNNKIYQLTQKFRTAARMPHARQKAIGKLGLTESVFARGLVTLRATKSRLNVRMASMHVPCTAVRPGVSVNVGTVILPSLGFKLQTIKGLHGSSHGLKDTRQYPLHTTTDLSLTLTAHLPALPCCRKCLSDQ